jgi:hypothetical protein
MPTKIVGTKRGHDRARRLLDRDMTSLLGDRLERNYRAIRREVR